MGAKIRAWDDRTTGPEVVEACRQEWQRRVNRELEKHGVEARVDLRSYERQAAAGDAPEGMIPQRHQGRWATERSRRLDREEGRDTSFAGRRRAYVRAHNEAVEADWQLERARTREAMREDGTSEAIAAAREGARRASEASATEAWAGEAEGSIEGGPPTPGASSQSGAPSSAEPVLVTAAAVTATGSAEAETPRRPSVERAGRWATGPASRDEPHGTHGDPEPSRAASKPGMGPSSGRRGTAGPSPKVPIDPSADPQARETTGSTPDLSGFEAKGTDVRKPPALIAPPAADLSTAAHPATPVGLPSGAEAGRSPVVEPPASAARPEVPLSSGPEEDPYAAAIRAARSGFAGVALDGEFGAEIDPEAYTAPDTVVAPRNAIRVKRPPSPRQRQRQRTRNE